MTVLTLTTGTAFIMWLGEQITERGIGNGMSLHHLRGDRGRLPARPHRHLQHDPARRAEPARRPPARGGHGLVVIAAIVFVERGQRRITVQYAKRVVGRRMYGRPVDPPAPAREHERRHPRDLRLLHHRLPPDDRVLLPGQQPLDAVGLRAAPLGDAALQPALRHLHHLLLLLLHRDRLQPRRRGGEHAQVRRLHPRHPSREEERRSTSTTSWAASPSGGPSTLRSSPSFPSS